MRASVSNMATRQHSMAGRSHMNDGGTDLLEVGDAEDEAYCVEDIGLATAVEAGDGVEVLVEARDHRALGVGLEALDDDAVDVHGCGCSLRLSITRGSRTWLPSAAEENPLWSLLSLAKTLPTLD